MWLADGRNTLLARLVLWELRMRRLTGLFALVLAAVGVGGVSACFSPGDDTASPRQHPRRPGGKDVDDAVDETDASVAAGPVAGTKPGSGPVSPDASVAEPVVDRAFLESKLRQFSAGERVSANGRSTARSWLQREYKALGFPNSCTVNSNDTASRDAWISARPVGIEMLARCS